MRTLNLDLARFRGAVIREAPTARAQRDGTPITTKDGEQIYAGRLLVPGVAESAFRDPAAGQVRLRLVGQLPQGLDDFQPVQLEGACTLTSWFNRSRQRGQDDGAGITITAENVRPLSDFPDLSGLLPVAPPSGDAFLVLDVQPAPNGNPGFDTRLALPSSIADYDSGTTTVRVTENPTELVGRPVRFVDMWAKAVAPAGEDVSRSSKASLVVFAKALEPVTPAMAAAGRGRREQPAENVNTDQVEA